MNQTCWGYELTIDAGECNSLVSDPVAIADFALELVEKIGMEAYGAPQIIHFGNDYLEGYTLIQLIHTSNITAHFNDKDRSCYLNVFSCKPFDRQVVTQVFGAFFEPKRIKENWQERNA